MGNQKVVTSVFSPVLDVVQLLKEVKHLRSLQRQSCTFRHAQFQDELRYSEKTVDSELSQFFKWYEDNAQQLELFPQTPEFD